MKKLTGMMRRTRAIMGIMSYLNRQEKKEFLLNQQVIIYSKIDPTRIFRVRLDKRSSTGISSAVFVQALYLNEYYQVTNNEPNGCFGHVHPFCSVPIFVTPITAYMSIESRFIALVLLLRADEEYVLKNSMRGEIFVTTQENFISRRRPR